MALFVFDFTLDNNTGNLGLTLGGGDTATAINPTQLTIQSTYNGSGVNYTLTGGTVTGPTANIATITLTARDFNTLKNYNVNGNVIATGYINTFISTVSTNFTTPPLSGGGLLPSSALAAASITTDSTPPSFITWARVGTQVTLTFTEPLKLTNPGALTAARITFQDDSSGTNTYTLTDSTLATTFSGANVNQMVVTLSATDAAAIPYSWTYVRINSAVTDVFGYPLSTNLASGTSGPPAVLPSSISGGGTFFGSGLIFGGAYTPPTPPLQNIFVAVSGRYNGGDLSNIAAASPDGVTWTQSTLPSTTFWQSVAYGNGVFVAVTRGNLASPSSDIAATSLDGITWTQRTLPVAAGWNSVTYGYNNFVAVAGGSSIAATSPDGVTWAQQTLPASDNWYSVTYGANTFVAVAGGLSSSNRAATSPDGVTWIQRTLPASDSWYSVTYGANTFVAVVLYSTIAATSPDGKTWTQTTLPANPPWSSIIYGADKFVAVAGAVFNPYSNIAATSPDGVTWTQRTLPVAAGWNSITYGANTFVAISVVTPGQSNSNRAATSPDGVTWTEQTIPSAEWFSVASSDLPLPPAPPPQPYFFEPWASGADSGVTWADYSSAQRAYNGVAYGFQGTSTFLSTTNGNTWTQTNRSFSGYDRLWAGNNTFVSVADDSPTSLNLLYSTDNGATWLGPTTVTGLVSGDALYSPMYYQLGSWYCVRSIDAGGGPDSTLFTSYRVGNLANTTWTEVDNNFGYWNGFYGSGQLTAIVDPVTQQVMVVGTTDNGKINDGNEQIMFNSNSASSGNWLTNRDPNVTIIPMDAALANTQIINSSIAAYNGRFLIAWSNSAGGNGIIGTNNQGSTWYNCTGLPNNQIYTSVVAGYANTYAAFASTGLIYYSTDGQAFTEDNTPQVDNIAGTISGNSGYVGLDVSIAVSYSRYI